ncbi:MAG: hypothetical protein CMJ76_04120 [Planctomycetaceae bacterium]|nr:hypothetical protein [Planctomycetaceae bacterium]|tara:strand:+ start:3149 stop:3685 length:537 start_codon:yes stop_codon:yes gene_type:complete
MPEFDDDLQNSGLPETDFSDQDSQQLVAYLDGELDEETCRLVEHRLSDDPEYRLRLQQLQQAWDLLDELPHANRDEGFTRSTVEFVALSARQDLEETQQWSRSGKQKTLINRVAITIAVTIVGFFLGDWFFGREHRQLLNDVEVISEFDQYRLTEDIQFLKDLEQSGVFDVEELSDEE